MTPRLTTNQQQLLNKVESQLKEMYEFHNQNTRADLKYGDTSEFTNQITNDWRESIWGGGETA